MAKSSTSFASPDGKVDTPRRAGKPKGGAKRRASPRSVTKADAATKPVGEQRGERSEAAGEATQPVVREAAAAAPRQPAAAEAPAGQLPSEERAATEEHGAAAPPPSPATEIPVAAAKVEPGPVASDAPAAGAAISGSGGGLVADTVRLHGELVAFGWRQTEQGLAAGRAMLASRSLTEVRALQSAWLGSAFGDALRHGLELSRLAGAMMRSGLPGR